MYNSQEKYIILFYNLMWDSDFDFSQLPIPSTFFITTDHSYIHTANAIVFHMPSLKGNERIDKRNGQLWVFWSMECEVHYPMLDRPEITNLFDLRMTYKANADVWVPYLQSDHTERLRQRPAKKKHFVNAFISSGFNQSKRRECLSDLMSLIPVHSYGKLLNNRPLEVDEGFQTKMDIIADYKFTLAFENAIAKDYVTEKFFDPLMAGSVPIYLGAPNIEEFAPGEKCYIDVSSFGCVNELAEYLLMLNENDRLYEEYLSWKDLPFTDAFMERVDHLRVHPFVRLCNVIKEILKK